MKPIPLLQHFACIKHGVTSTLAKVTLKTIWIRW